jgi:hypothetical protein
LELSTQAVAEVALTQVLLLAVLAVLVVVATAD